MMVARASGLTLVLLLAVVPLAGQQTVQVGMVAPFPTVGTDVTVGTAAQFTAALAKGGTIRLSPATYVGNFTVSVAGTRVLGFVLPEARVAAGATSGIVFKAADATRPPITVSASNTTLQGFTLQAVADDRAVLSVGSPNVTTPEQQPDSVMLDRLEVLATATGGKRGIEAHSRRLTLQRSRVIGFVYAGADSQAFLAVNGPGPYQLIDNELQGSGENVMFGGASIRSAAMVPSAVVQSNFVYKPAAWRTRTGSVKNSIECKACNGALIADNVIDGCWADAQTGSMIVITPRNQYNDSPWAVVQDVVIRGNRSIHHTQGHAVNILYTDDNFPSRPTARVTVDHNLFQDSPNGVQFNGGIEDWAKVTNNTFPAITGKIVTFTPATPFHKFVLTVTGNVAKSGGYGVLGDGSSPGSVSLTAYTTSWTMTGNVIEQSAERTISYPAGNTILPVGGLASKLDSLFKYIPGGAGW